MRRAICLAFAIWLFSAVPSFAQAMLPPAFPQTDPLLGAPDPAQLPPNAVIVDVAPPQPTGPVRWWVRAEYLNWWVKNAPLPVSLVTTGDTNFNSGAELLNSDRHYGAFSGMRVGVGHWFDDCNNIGLDGSVFFLGRRTNHYFTDSDNAGNPMLAFPFTSTTPGATGQFVMPITSPGQYAGNVLVSSSLELWGAEVNGAFCLVREPGVEFTMLAGFRYLELRERLNITSVSSDFRTNPDTLTILSDNFNTRNQFYGGQLGARANWQSTWLALDLTGKVAFGSTSNLVDIQGASSQFGPTQPNGTFPGGFFTQPSNIGQRTTNHFAVVPSIEAKVHFVLSPRCRVFVGYDFLYWTNVTRPGNQVDTNINLSQSPVLGSNNGVLVGPASPGPLSNRSDFFAHGINVGFEMRF